MSPSLYDLLDVDETATDEEIRAAWKAAIADLGPTDRRFRAYNQAAEVLLDPEKRAAYDAERAASEPEEAVTPSWSSSPSRGTSDGRIETPEPAIEPAPDEEPEESTGDEAEPGATREPAGWIPAAVAAVAVAVLAATVLVWVQQFRDGSDDAWVDSAIDAAVEAAPKALAYDYRSFDEDISAAQELMTSDQRARHNELMADLRGDVVSQKAVVESQVVGSGLVRGDSDRAEVLVLVNQNTTKKDDRGKDQEVVIPLWVTFEMVSNDGEWLLDRMVNEGVVASSGESTPGSEPSPGSTESPAEPEGTESPTGDDETGAPDDTESPGE